MAQMKVEVWTDCNEAQALLCAINLLTTAKIQDLGLLRETAQLANFSLQRFKLEIERQYQIINSRSAK